MCKVHFSKAATTSYPFSILYYCNLPNFELNYQSPENCTPIEMEKLATFIMSVDGWGS